MNPIFLFVPQIFRIHAKQLARHGGLAGVRQPGLIDSALAQPMAMFGGVYLHDDLFLMAAAFLFHLARNHAFVDANKRVALVAALFFLEVNGYQVDDPDGILYDLTIAVTEGHADKSEIAATLRGLARLNR